MTLWINFIVYKIQDLWATRNSQEKMSARGYGEIVFYIVSSDTDNIIELVLCGHSLGLVLLDSLL